MILAQPAKQIALSGPAGFLGSRVLKALLAAHAYRMEKGLDPGEIVLLSSSPGTLMSGLTEKYGRALMANVRGCRVDYFHQHDVDSWHDQLGSLGMGGRNAVFINTAALAGPRVDRPAAMMEVNYRAPAAASQACEALGFGHWIQSSTQATKAERAGQVPYSRWKSMCDFHLARLERLPVSVFSLGILYDRGHGVVGQRGSGLNLVDLTLLPLTPVMGDGTAPLQPLEVDDAAHRIAFLALTDPSLRPPQQHDEFSSLSWDRRQSWAQLMLNKQRHYTLRLYDAVGPETITMLELLAMFAQLHERTLRPVFVDYRNFEKILNVSALGNLNRQFVSLLRSEQETLEPVLGKHAVFETLLGPKAKLARITDEAKTMARRGGFPYLPTLRWALENRGVIPPSIALSLEIIHSYLTSRQPNSCSRPEDGES